MSSFPVPWLDLLVEHSSLGREAPELIAQIEKNISASEAAGVTVFPIKENRYRALTIVPPDSVRACLFGQDPYHGSFTIPGGVEIPQATGLSFSVPACAKQPPSLRNIFKELYADTGELPTSGDLSHWADQGLLMLNTILTVDQGKPKSPVNMGWQIITGALIEALSKTRPGIVFLLWGNSAQELKEHIADRQHTIIESSHPSPIGGACNRGFFGSRPFSRTNAALLAQGKMAIQWSHAAC